MAGAPLCPLCAGEIGEGRSSHRGARHMLRADTGFQLLRSSGGRCWPWAAPQRHTTAVTEPAPATSQAPGRARGASPSPLESPEGVSPALEGERGDKGGAVWPGHRSRQVHSCLQAGCHTLLGPRGWGASAVLPEGRPVLSHPGSQGAGAAWSSADAPGPVQKAPQCDTSFCESQAKHGHTSCCAGAPVCVVCGTVVPCAGPGGPGQGRQHGARPGV